MPAAPALSSEVSTDLYTPVSPSVYTDTDTDVSPQVSPWAAADAETKKPAEKPAEKPAKSAEKAQEKEQEKKAETAEPESDIATGTIKAPKEFRILNTATGKVQRVPRSEYVRGAVCAEMPPSFHTQALAAQALAANTYAMRCAAEQKASPDPALKGADFSADPDNWRGYVTEKQAKERFGDKFSVYWGKICEAADMGGAYAAVYENEPIAAAYHSLSSGQTEDAANVWRGSAPYLSPVESFGDTLAEGYETTASFTPQEVKRLLTNENSKVSLKDGEYEGWFEVKKRSGSGYVLKAECGGEMFSGIDLRRIFGLRSSDFEVSFADKRFTFTVVGYGHGVGLSQYGADYMARQGASFDEIALHYYSGCELKRINKV